MVVFGMAAMIVVQGGLAIGTLALLLILVGLPAVVVFELRAILRKPDTIGRIGLEVALLAFAVTLVAALPPFMRSISAMVEIRALSRAERAVDRSRTISAFPVSEPGFAGRSFFTLVVFDRTGEIERNPESRSAAWWLEARRADGILAACSREMSVRRLKPDFYWVETAC